MKTKEMILLQKLLSYERIKEIEKEVEKDMVPLRILEAIIVFMAAISVCIEIGRGILEIIGQ